MLPFLGVNSVSESLTQEKTGLPSLRAHRERGEERGRRELRGSSNLQLKAVYPPSVTHTAGIGQELPLTTHTAFLSQVI